MNIYFSCSITGGRSEERIYQVLVQELIEHGHEVPTAHLSLSNVIEVEKIVNPVDVFTRDMNWLKNCDVVVAEVTSPSHGVGYEIAFALSLGKPVLCCFKKGKKVSMIITGNTDKNIFLAPYATEVEAIGAVEAFLQNQSNNIRI